MVEHAGNNNNNTNNKQKTHVNSTYMCPDCGSEGSEPELMIA